MRGRSSISSCRLELYLERESVGGGPKPNRGTMTAFWVSGAEAVRRASWRTNTTAPAATLLHLSSSRSLGGVVEF